MKNGFWVTLVFILLFVVPTAFAGESGSGWRSTYDVIMLWVNFGILAFLLIKFLRVPIREFLGQQKRQLTEEIESLESQKAEVSAKIEAFQEQKENVRERLNQIQQRILDEGERRKLEIIREAEVHSRNMIEDSKRKMAFRIQKARAQFREELVDVAMGLAIKNIEKEFTEADDKQFVENYIAQIET